MALEILKTSWSSTLKKSEQSRAEQSKVTGQ